MPKVNSLSSGASNHVNTDVVLTSGAHDRRMSIGFDAASEEPTKSSATAGKLPVSHTETSMRYHLHTMWYPRSRMKPNIDGTAFRSSLFEAYTSMHEALANASDLVSAGHLWTEYQHDADALTSLIASSADQSIPLYVHTKNDLSVLTQQQSPAIHRLLERLQSMPATENIGLRSDIERMVYGLAYQEIPSAAENQFNVHLDVDTLKEFGRSSGSGYKMTAAGPPALLSENIGFASQADRNDMLFIRPGHQDAVRVAAKMFHVMEKGEFPLDIGGSKEIAEMSERWTQGTRFLTSLLRSLATEDTSALGSAVSSGEMMKRFTMADVLCKQRDAVQLRVDALVNELRESNPHPTRIVQLQAKIMGISEVFRSCAQMIESYVNLCVFLPQIEHAHQGGAEAADTLCRSIFGKSLPAAGASTWRAGTLSIPNELQPHSLTPHHLESSMKEGFAELKSLLPAQLL